MDQEDAEKAAAAGDLQPATPKSDSRLAMAWRQVWTAWASVRRLELGGFVLLGLLFGAVDLSSLAERHAGDPLWPVVARQLLSPLLCALCLLPFWLVADRSDPQHPARWLRLGLATLLGAVVAVLLLWQLVAWLGWPSPSDLSRHHKGLPMLRHPDSGVLLGYIISVWLPATLMVAVFELRRRRQATEAATQQLLAEQARLSRSLLASRLAARQAQLEPAWLFELLSAVEQRQAQGEADALPLLERLIQHLRLVLPGLRDAHVPVQDEAQRLASHLALEAAWRRLPLKFDWSADDPAAQVPAMLLLPWAQHALRPGTAWPHTVRLSATTAAPGGLALTLFFEGGGPCGSPEELALQRQRLQVLAGEGAELHCQTLPASPTGPHGLLLSLHLPP